MRANRRRDTGPELRIRQRLFARGYRFRVDYPVLRKPSRRADIAFTRIKLAIFIDGCFWHGCPEHGSMAKSNEGYWRDKIRANKVRDLDTNERLEREGWLVARI